MSMTFDLSQGYLLIFTQLVKRIATLFTLVTKCFAAEILTRKS